MRFLLMLFLPALVQAQDSCAVFSPEIDYEVRSMGYFPSDPEWESVNYVIHVHHTDSIPGSAIPEAVVWDAHDHLNEEFEEAMFSFDLIDIKYHDFDDFAQAPYILDVSCFPYSHNGWNVMDSYVDSVQWDQETIMNVHIFPQFCAGLLGFAWTAYIDQNVFDGAWIRTDVFGRFGDHLTNPARMGNKTMIHEVGHYLSLHHVFRGVEFCGQDLGDCEETGDYVCDTPPIKTSWTCESPICPPDLYGFTPNNHMDYYVDSCRTNFTQGQIERMHQQLPITRPGIANAGPFCSGDLNGDLIVGSEDLLMMLTHMGNVYWEEGDLTGDGYFTVSDVQVVLANYGNTCYGAEMDELYREKGPTTSLVADPRSESSTNESRVTTQR